MHCSVLLVCITYSFPLQWINYVVGKMKEKEGLLYKEQQELDVMVVDGLEKAPAITIEKPPDDW